MKRVLILNEVGASSPGLGIIDNGIMTALQDSPYHIQFYIEYMDSVLFPDAADQQKFREFYIAKYTKRKPDVIVTVGPTPLRFMIDAHRQLFPGIPIVFCLRNAGQQTFPQLDPEFTGVEDAMAVAETLEAALRLVPGTEHVVVTGGVSAWDRQEEAVIKEAIKPYEQRLDISYLTDLSLPDLLERVSHLPDHTIVLMATLTKDGDGTLYISSSESGPMVAKAANVPVFSFFDLFLNHGIVGGDISDFDKQGRAAGSITLKLLNGERPQDIPTVKDVTTYMFDWKALQRWGLKTEDLPPGSIVLNRQLSFWDLYKQYFLAGIVVIFVQTLAIIGLLWQRARRRKIEAELRRSEERFAKSFRQSPLVATITSAGDFHYVEVNETFEQQTGWKREEVIGRTPQEINIWVDPDHAVAFRQQLLANGSVRDFELKLRRRDGQVRTVLVSAEMIDLNGRQCALSAAADITERNEAADALASVSRRLIDAQDQERARIARELHDDINQRIAMVAVNLRLLKQYVPASQANIAPRIEELSAYVSGIEKDVQALSHQLHSSKLEYLGLEEAAASFCREFSEQQDVRVDYRPSNVPDPLPNGAPLCLLRVLQEALHNAFKYSGVREFEVMLTGGANEVRLVVRDSGVGFDLSKASRGQGLGLASMRERLKLVNGELAIESRPQSGTTVSARIPLNETSPLAEEKAQSVYRTS